jgi:hypothetical protein
MQKYEFFAHSAIGTRMWEAQLGLNFGRRVPILPNTFFQGRYSYGYSQRILGIRPNHSRVEVGLGHFLTRRLSVRALAYSMFTHGGLTWDEIPDEGPRWIHHDQTGKIHLLNLGGGFAYAVNDSLDVFASILTTAWSHNHHATLAGVVTGVSWSFRTRRAGLQLAFQNEKTDGSPVQTTCRKVRCACK